MATNDPKKHSITGNLVANMLTEREDDYTFNVTYTANRTIKDLCKLAAAGKSKFTASELESAYNDLKEQAKTELFTSATVEFGFTNNMLGVDGPFIGPEAKFDPAVNSVTMRCIPRTEFKSDLESISVIVGQVSEGLPTITKVTDVVTGEVNARITPGGSLNGTGKRVRIVGEEGKPVGFFFINTNDQTEKAVPMTALSRNDPSYFSFIIPSLPDGSYYLEVATQAGTNNKTLVKEVRRNRFPYVLTVGAGGSDRPEIE
ncbi:DUF4469 domain-containing protein [uncultured Parabacteroides sp.]|uniref:DUF4469 domain-containing protein n=1 Tax=uncultured Parabacteroides sp. TaxID=512312 RepID=UPI0025982B19|nr:DUF4469 domain-containing protein [uncultured Parabacteroides sp.]